jgi:hypothetical protein
LQRATVARIQPAAVGEARERNAKHQGSARKQAMLTTRQQ